jgi:energy-coupling factor transport system ATP-binding protein
MQISFQDISYWYARGTPFEKQALNHISAMIPTGQFVAFMGQTGSGKTTLAQMINGLLRPTDGEVRVGDFTITHKKQDLRALRSRIGYAFQYPEHQLFEETVFKDIAFSLRQNEIPEEMITSRVKRAMELVGLNYELLHDRSPFQLSGGQMRRVALAGVLAINPEVLILDEPTAGLDPLGRIELLQLVKRLHAEHQLTVIYITHHLEEAMEYAERILFMKQGQLVADLHPMEVPDHLDQLAVAGILSTPLIEVKQALNVRMGMKLPQEIYREDEMIHYLEKLLKGEE